MSSLLWAVFFLSTIISPSLVLAQGYDGWCGPPPDDCASAAEGDKFGDPANCECYHECVLGALVYLCCDDDPALACFDDVTKTCMDCDSALCCRGTEPLNVAILQNSSDSLDCGMPNAEAHSWAEFITLGEPYAKNIYLEDLYVGEPEDAAHYNLSTEPNGAPTDYHLDVLDVQPRYAGKYRCQGQDEVAISHLAEVIVLEDNIQCMQNSTPLFLYVEGEVAKISCAVFFHGAWGPIMEWSGASSMPPLINGSIGNFVHYYFEQMMVPGLNGQSYTCDLRFPEPVDPLPEHATNAPIYTDQCTTTLSVYYTPRNTAVLNGVVVHPGMPIDCYSESNPPPFMYTWYLNDTLLPNEEATITIMEEGSYRVLCCATNDIHGLTYMDCSLMQPIIIEDLTDKCPPANCTSAAVSLMAYDAYGAYDGEPTLANQSCNYTCPGSDDSSDSTLMVVVVILAASVILLLATTAALAWLYWQQKTQVVDRSGIDNPNYSVKS